MADSATWILQLNAEGEAMDEAGQWQERIITDDSGAEWRARHMKGVGAQGMHNATPTTEVEFTDPKSGRKIVGTVKAGPPADDEELRGALRDALRDAENDA